MLDLFDMVAKRKSYRSFRDDKKLDIKTLEDIITEFPIPFSEISLEEDLPIIEIVDRHSTSCPRGDLCICYYGSRTTKGLVNAGYYLEHLDLYLQSKGIGVCWYGFGRTKIKVKDSKDFVIMLNAGYAEENSLRGSISDFKRNDISAIWHGDFDQNIKQCVSLAPSACNSQPWIISSFNGEITVERGDGNRSIMIGKIKTYFNNIDMGICLCFLELALRHYGYGFDRELLCEDRLIARYRLK